MKVNWIDIGKIDIVIKEKTYEVTKLPITKVDSNSFLKEGNEKEIEARILDVIEIEAPITEWLLIKRVINSFGVYKAGIHVRKKMFDILDGMDLKSTEEYDNKIYWKESIRPSRYKTFRVPGRSEESARDITNIAVSELSNCVYQVLVEEGELEYEELARLTALRLGYTRMGSNVRLGMKRAIEMAVDRYPIKKQGNIYRAYNSGNMLK